MDNKANFINKANLIHNFKYDYSKVNYINAVTKVIIICPSHGEFRQQPCKHIYRKQGCPDCSNSKKSNVEEFIKKSNLVHNNKYNYSKVNYINALTKVKIICPKHGEFEQSPHGHLKGYGCIKCSKQYMLGRKNFITKANKIHGNIYDYSKVDYINTKTRIKVICPDHGEFEQLPLNHLYNKNGCPKCISNISLGQKEIINHISNNYEVIVGDRNIIKPYELDIFIPEIKLAIEYNGLYFHSFNRDESTKERNYHKMKYELCKKNGIQLIQIFENEWNFKQKIVKSILNNKTKFCNNKIHARKCKTIELSSNEFNMFCLENHIQGCINTKFRYGLLYDDDIVQVIGFNKYLNGFTCTRLCSKLNVVVNGGSSKLFNNFLLKIKPKFILTYADARYSNGNVYNKLGFKYINHTKPNYFYVKNDCIFTRLGFQKNKLKCKIKNFNENLTESNNMFNNGYRRIWDAGHLKFLFM